MEANFGEYIRKLRTESGLTLTQLGAKLGIDSGALSKIETGKKEFDEKYLNNLSNAFNLDIEKLKIYWLANRDKNLYMAVLADFKDYKEETAPYDRELMEYAKKCIQEVSDSPEIKAYFKDKSGIENRFMVFFRVIAFYDM